MAGLSFPSVKQGSYPVKVEKLFISSKRKIISTHRIIEKLTGKVSGFLSSEKRIIFNRQRPCKDRIL